MNPLLATALAAALGWFAVALAIAWHIAGAAGHKHTWTPWKTTCTVTLYDEFSRGRPTGVKYEQHRTCTECGHLDIRLTRKA